MTALVLNKRFPLDLMATWLAGMEEDVLLVCGPSVAPPEHPGYALAGLRRLEFRADYDRSDWLVPYCRQHAVDRVVTAAEGDVVRAALVRELLGLQGQPVAGALAYRDKYLMKSIAAAHGLPTAPMAPAAGVADVARFAAAHGYPVLVKPRDAAACRGVTVIRGEQDLALVAPKLDHLVEAWIDLPLFHVDGLMRDGRVLHCSASRYAMPNLESTRAGLPCASVMLDPAADKRAALLCRLTGDAVRMLPGTPHTTAFHAEFFCDDGDKALLCEIACRPGNTALAEASERAYGYNLYREIFRGQIADAPFDPPVGGPAGLFGWAFFPPRDGVLERLPAAAHPSMLWLEVKARPGSSHRRSQAPLDHVAKALFQADPAAADSCLAAVLDWWAEGAVWS